MRFVFLCLAAASAYEASPVTQVVTLLRDLQAKIQADDAAETKVYNKYTCWCRDTTLRKQTSIDTGIKTIATETNNIHMESAAIRGNENRIEEMENQIRDHKEMIEELTNIRQKKNGEFMYTREETEEAMTALEQAIKRLDKAGQGASEGSDITRTALVTVNKVIQRAPDASFNVHLLKKMDQAQSFLQSGYTPQSGTVTGMLKEMFEQFAINTENLWANELSQTAAFNTKVKNHNAQIDTCEDIKAKEEEKKAVNEQDLATAMAAHEAATEQLKADKEFFANTFAACSEKASDWSLRSQRRHEELTGVKAAIDILASDDNRELFTKATNTRPTGFIQTSHSSANAITALLKKATPAHKTALLAIAAQMRMGGNFDAVVKAIDDMLETLKTEEAQDISNRDGCISDRHEQTSELQLQNHLTDRTQRKMDAQNAKIDDLSDQIKANEDAMQAMRETIDQMTSDRNDERLAFEDAKLTDEKAIDALTRALAQLEAFFGNDHADKNELLQQPEFAISEDQAPQADLDADYGGRKSTTAPILAMLKQIKENLEQEVRTGVANEKKAIAEYNKMMGEGNASLNAMKTQDIALNNAKTETQVALGVTTGENGAAIAAAGTAQGELDKIRPDCDWVMSSFEKRLADRKAEREGLTQAKALLSGAKP